MPTTYEPLPHEEHGLHSVVSNDQLEIEVVSMPQIDSIFLPLVLMMLYDFHWQ
jgi:hypothetical protein